MRLISSRGTKRVLAREKFSSVSRLFSYCTESYERREGSPLSVFIVFPLGETRPEEIEEIAKERGLTFLATKTGDNIYKVKLGVQSRIMKFHIITNDDWWLFFSDENSTVLRNVLVESFIGNHLSWALESAYLQTDQLADIINEISEDYDEVSILGCKYYQLGVTNLEFRKPGYRIQYTKGILKELENGVNGTISAVKFSFRHLGATINKARILTKSHIVFYDGLFTRFYQSVVLPYAELALKTKERYSNRERIVKTEGVRLSPSEIICRKSFTQGQIGELKKVLVREYSTSVVHHNPVMIAHSTDRIDGSCFDIYLDDDRIEIVPLNYATSGSFTRLLSTLLKYSPQVVEIKDKKPVVLR